MIQLQLQPEIEAQLAAEAAACGLDIDKYLEKIVQARHGEQAAQTSIAAAINNIKNLRKGNILGGISIKNLISDGRKY